MKKDFICDVDIKLLDMKQTLEEIYIKMHNILLSVCQIQKHFGA